MKLTRVVDLELLHNNRYTQIDPSGTTAVASKSELQVVLLFSNAWNKRALRGPHSYRLQVYC